MSEADEYGPGGLYESGPNTEYDRPDDSMTVRTSVAAQPPVVEQELWVRILVGTLAGYVAEVLNIKRRRTCCPNSSSRHDYLLRAGSGRGWWYSGDEIELLPPDSEVSR
jgi:hypothetical protein